MKTMLKKTKSGKLLEVDYYPAWDSGKAVPSRSPKRNRSTAEQLRYNYRQTVKKLIRKVNANFDNTDIFMHLTYIQEYAPKTEEDARKDIVNYLRRVKTWRAAELKRLMKAPDTETNREKIRKLQQPLKYIYVIEKVVYKSGKKKGKMNFHFHFFITGSGAGDRDRYEKMWKKGVRVNADRFQPETFGPEAAAVYIAKDPEGTRRFACSKNLTKPEARHPSNAHLTRAGLERVAKERVDDAGYWERKHKGYRFLKCYSRYNPYNGCWYASVIMYRTDGDPPAWNMPDWIEEGEYP